MMPDLHSTTSLAACSAEPSATETAAGSVFVASWGSVWRNVEGKVSSLEVISMTFSISPVKTSSGVKVSRAAIFGQL